MISGIRIRIARSRVSTVRQFSSPVLAHADALHHSRRRFPLRGTRRCWLMIHFASAGMVAIILLFFVGVALIGLQALASLEIAERTLKMSLTWGVEE